MSKDVAYFRVSTARQGQSGLGLEAQQAVVHRLLPTDAVRVADYVEVESGRQSARPQLRAAIAQAQREEAVLLVAKLDRLARSVAFLAALMASRVRIQALDLPAADEFTLRQRNDHRTLRLFGVDDQLEKCANSGFTQPDEALW